MAQYEILALNTSVPQIQAAQAGDTYVAKRDVSVEADLDSESYRLRANGVVTDTGTARTLSADDNGKVLYFTSSSTVTVTTASGLGAGFACVIVQGGSGQVQLAQGSGTSLVSYSAYLKLSGQYAVATLISPVANTFFATGQLSL
jgi:hypothetical protein